jgi:hypothetical protein
MMVDLHKGPSNYPECARIRSAAAIAPATIWRKCYPGESMSAEGGEGVEDGKAWHYTKCGQNMQLLQGGNIILRSEA